MSYNKSDSRLNVNRGSDGNTGYDSNASPE